VRVEVERAEKRLFAIDEEYRAAGGELLEKRDAAEASVASLRGELDGAQDELRTEMSDNAPLLQVRNLLTEMLGQLEVEVKSRREATILGVVADRDKAILELLRSTKASARAVAAVQQYIDDDYRDRASASGTQEIVGIQESSPVSFLLGSALTSTETRIRTLLTRSQHLRAELDQAERVLVAIPDLDALAPLIKERDEARQALLQCRAAETHAEEHLNVLRQERARADGLYESALDDAAHANLAVDDSRRLVEHLDRVRATLDELRGAASRRHLGRISQLILEALGSLLRKENLITSVEIDAETHVVELSGRHGLPLPAQDLSAGERQLLAVALLWGLARASGQPLPVVIDTPLGRLDGSHRGHLLDRYFPFASHQVILLSTDTEIDQDAYEQISRFVGRSYQLVYDSTSNATSVHDGYFWE
jgi:DNA sulfur modification protein DndD